MTTNRTMTRRNLVALLPAAAAVGLASAPAQADAVLGDDGLYHQSWFLNSFLDLREDLESAASEGKRLAIMWELRGCPYCRETHLVNFADQEIADYIRANFEVLQLNLLGARKVIDFDGKELAEKELAERYAIRFTPTFQFFPPSAEGVSTKEPLAREVARAPGYLKPPHFLAMFRFVRERAYERGTFRDYLASTKG
ncbi:thioredoxin family protein [Bradyrhizobium sp. HKCCYLS2058]|uniref:thioredoxin family protein n=1 Tax=Bradyrhizobium TaxID=374 RepID=UPI0028EA9A82|nr:MULTISPECIES: thioredoxin family protein [unclassified Bradyrhizobium]